MTEIIESVPKEIDERQLSAQLVEQARAQGVDLVGQRSVSTPGNRGTASWHPTGSCAPCLSSYVAANKERAGTVP